MHTIACIFFLQGVNVGKSVELTIFVCKLHITQCNIIHYNYKIFIIRVYIYLGTKTVSSEFHQLSLAKSNISFKIYVKHVDIKKKLLKLLSKRSILHDHLCFDLLEGICKFEHLF